ncbi:MAG TPA: ArsR family transcriptional regulator [Proteobacteria bacterium]|nr:ArsR family transcriptional regulator [Pseudomonadota bacterium]
MKRSIIPDAEIARLTDIFKVLSDRTRTKILLALSKGELCVCDVAHVVGLSLSAVSHQLRMLRNLGLVTYRNKGKMVFYDLNNKHIMKLVEEGIKHISK